MSDSSAYKWRSEASNRMRIAVVGSPSDPEVEWTDETLSELVDLGFTAVQVNIAWSYRPGDEPLNLEDVWGDEGRVNFRRVEIADRARLAREHGLSTMFHFGAPFQGRAGFDAAVLPNCISDPGVLKSYRDRVAAFGAAMPELDDLLMYTYDQDAWICSEFGDCPRCAGIPLHRRLPEFVNSVAEGWRAAHPKGRTWWEPWELSAGQVLASVPRLTRESTGLMVHSNIGEVISTMPADLFLRTLGEECAPLGIPVVAEVFLSSSNEEVEPWVALPVPLVTVAQLRAVERMTGFVGVKEYFGTRPGSFDVNLTAAGAYFADPTRDDAEILEAAAVRLGMEDTAVRTFWAQSSRAYRLLPWDTSWFCRQLGRSQVDHELSAATLRGSQSGASQWDTPAWRSTRAATFMRIESSEPHPWLLEDVGLRFGLAADAMDAAIDTLRTYLRGAGIVVALLAQLSEAIGFATRCRAYALHLRETNVARLLRESRLTDARRRDLEVEMAVLLKQDLDNHKRELDRRKEFGWDAGTASALQEHERWVVIDRLSTDRIREAITLFTLDPAKFLTVYFLEAPLTAARGQFSLTSR